MFTKIYKFYVIGAGTALGIAALALAVLALPGTWYHL